MIVIIILFTLIICTSLYWIIWSLLRRQKQQNYCLTKKFNNYNSYGSDANNDIMCPAKTANQRRLSSVLVKTITVHTCVGIYDEQMKQWRPDFYHYGTENGLELTIDYVDTFNDVEDGDNQKFDKTIVAIHGVPGYYTHFDKLVEFYRQTNVRVIVPNLPDFSHTRKTRTFWHTSIEKATFLRDFLYKLNVKTVDCLVGHSFGAQTVAAICEYPGDLEIKSIAFLSPQPLWDPVSNEEMLKAFKHKSEWWYTFLSLMRVHKKAYKKLRFKNINEFLLLCTIGIEDDTPKKFEKRLDIIKSMNIPIVIINGENERLISKTSQQRFNQYLNIDSNDIKFVDSDKYENDNNNDDDDDDDDDDMIDNDDNDNNITNGNGNANVSDNNDDKDLKLTKKYTSFIIKNGGHFTHCNHHMVANKIIDNLINFNPLNTDDN